MWNCYRVMVIVIVSDKTVTEVWMKESIVNCRKCGANVISKYGCPFSFHIVGLLGTMVLPPLALVWIWVYWSYKETERMCCDKCGHREINHTKKY